MTRRRFVQSAAGALLLPRFAPGQSTENVHFNVAEFDRARILRVADVALQQKPFLLADFPTPVKTPEDRAYFSQAVDWWPVEGATARYEQRPGLTNPRAFTAHRDALIRLNGVVAGCVAAWRLTGDRRYAEHALSHLRVWFIDAATRMEPALDHAGCLPPSIEGTAAGVQETVCLTELVRAASFLCAFNGPASEADATGLRNWFTAFSSWLNDSKLGFIAREEKDCTAICWTAQAAECARFTRNEALQLECSHRFRDRLLRQMNFDGQLPAELHQPNAYRSSLFALDCLSLTCEVLSSPMDRLWDYNLPDGRGMRSAVSFLYPAIENRAVWKLPADREHFTQWPVRQPSLLLAGRAYGRPEYLTTWKRLPAEPALPELLRYFPVRQPSLWTVRPPA